MPDETGTRTVLEAWRARRELGWDFRTWFTANGGHVTQIFRQRCYSNRCGDCSELIVKRVPLIDNRRWYGRWPTYCPECYAERERAHDARAADRMRSMRARRNEFRDAQYAERGWDPPKPGRPHGS